MLTTQKKSQLFLLSSLAILDTYFIFLSNSPSIIWTQLKLLTVQSTVRYSHTASLATKKQ